MTDLQHSHLICNKRKAEQDPVLNIEQLVNARGTGKRAKRGPYKKKQKLSVFELTEKGRKTFANDAAVQTTYKVKLGEQWTGKKLSDVEQDLREVVADK